MRKFSKLNESVEIDIDKVESALSKLQDMKYKVFDYFYVPSQPAKSAVSAPSHTRLVDDLKDIKPGSKNAKAILISPKLSYESLDISGWHDKMNFSSSGFYFNSVDDLKIIYSQIFQLVDELKEYSPKVCIKDERFIIYLIGDELTEFDLGVQKELEKAYEKLYQKLHSYSEGKKYIKNVDFWPQSLTLFAEIKGGEERLLTTLASLCPHMSNKKGYEWIKAQKKDEELEDIADVINELGFLIEFISPHYSDEIRKSQYKFKLVEI